MKRLDKVNLHKIVFWSLCFLTPQMRASAGICQTPKMPIVVQCCHHKPHECVGKSKNARNAKPALFSSVENPTHPSQKLCAMETAANLLDQFVDINALDVYGQTALHRAAAYGSFTGVSFLLDKGADVSVMNGDGKTALDLAKYYQHTEVIQELEAYEKLQMSKKPKTPEVSNRSNMSAPLRSVTRMLLPKGHQFIPLILGNNSNAVNQVVDDGYETLLHIATRKGNLSAVRCLIDAGADIHVVNFYKNTPLHVAASGGHLDVVRYLIDSGADINVANKAGYTALYEAVRCGQINIIEHFIERGENIHTVCSGELGKTLLHVAVRYGLLDVVKYLVGRGFIIESLDDHECRPLHEAAQRGHLEIAKYLVHQGADIHSCTRSGRNLLHCAASTQNADLVEFFCHQGVNVNAINNKNRITPLHQAACGWSPAVVQVLLDNGADRDIVDKDGNLPLHYTVENKNWELFRKLLPADKQAAERHTRRIIQSLTDNSLLSALRYFIEEGYDLEATDDLGRTVLFSEVESENVRTIQQLVDLGANIDAVDSAGWTPLFLAIKQNSPQVVNALIEVGADINAADQVGWTPLFLAISHGDLDMVKILLAAGADINAVDQAGWTPLYLAQVHKDKTMIAFLQQTLARE